MAQLIEEVSILTADRRRKKPVEVLRPAKKVASDRRSSSGDKGAIPAMKHGGLLAAAVGAGRVSSRG